MNINIIEKLFNKVSILEDCYNYYFRPEYSKKCGKRNIFHNEIKQDFIDDINLYGFFPFSVKSFYHQMRDSNITKYLTRSINFFEFQKSERRGLTPLSVKLRQIKDKTVNKNKFNYLKYISKLFLPKNQKVDVNIKVINDKKNFLSRAFGKLGRNKINSSHDYLKRLYQSNDTDLQNNDNNNNGIIEKKSELKNYMLQVKAMNNKFQKKINLNKGRNNLKIKTKKDLINFYNTKKLSKNFSSDMISKSTNIHNKNSETKNLSSWIFDRARPFTTRKKIS